MNWNNWPQGFWTLLTGLLSFAAAVLVVWRTNKSNDDRHIRQLAHDRKLNEQRIDADRGKLRIEQEFDLRKDVYLNAVEAMQAGLIMVSELADVNLEIAAISESFREKAPALAKVTVVAGLPAVQAVYDASITFSATITRLTIERMALANKRLENDTLNVRLRERFGEIEALQKVVELETDGQKKLRGESRLRGLRADFQNWKNKFDVDQAEYFAQLLALLDKCNTATGELWNNMIHAFVEIRRDLQMPIDEAEFRSSMKASGAKQQLIIGEFIDAIRNTSGD